MSARRIAGVTVLACALTAIALFAALLALPLHASVVHAQAPEADVLGVERQLRCPQCTNERLDVCDLRICEDMRTQIRQRLTAGESPERIVESFRALYGDRILWELPRHGFNLALLGWVGASVLAVLLGGGLTLRRMRRTGRPAARPLTPEDEAWLDQEITRGITDHADGTMRPPQGGP